MIDFQPRYVTFDLYGTLTAFGMSALTRELFSDRIPIGQMEDFVKDFAGYRIDEVLGAYKPYRQVIKDSKETLTQAIERGKEAYQQARETS